MFPERKNNSTLLHPKTISNHRPPLPRHSAARSWNSWWTGRRLGRPGTNVPSGEESVWGGSNISLSFFLFFCFSPDVSVVFCSTKSRCCLLCLEFLCVLHCFYTVVVFLGCFEDGVWVFCWFWWCLLPMFYAKVCCFFRWYCWLFLLVFCFVFSSVVSWQFFLCVRIVVLRGSLSVKAQSPLKNADLFG